MRKSFKTAGVTSKLLFACILELTSLLTFAQVAENDFNYNIGTGFNGIVNASAIDANGKLVVGGAFTSFNGITRNRIARLNTDGTLDTGFDPGTGFNGTVYALAIQPSDGKIIVGGDFTTFDVNTQNVIFRLNTNGSYDNTFVTTGTGVQNLIYGLALQVDGKIVIGGLFTSYNGTSRNYIARLNSTGTLDTGFDPGTGFNNWVRCVAVQSDGSILAGGDFTQYAGTTNVNYFTKLGTTGTLDAAFKANVFVPGKVYAIALASGGKILTGGSNSGTSDVSGKLYRHMSTGVGDITAPTEGGLVKSIAIQSNGKILAGGTMESGLRRHLESNLTLENFVNVNGFVGGTSGVNTISVQSNGNILAGGDFTTFQGISRSKIARLTTCSSVAITTQPAERTICVSNTTTFNAVATGTGLIYKWQVNTTSGFGLYSDLSDDATYSGTATNTLGVTPSATTFNGYRFRCLVKDASCTSTSLAAILSVQATPSISAHPGDKTECVGATTNFSVTSTATSYQWQYDPGTGFTNWTISNANLTTLTVSGITASMNGYKFRCIVGPCSPSVVSNAATLTVNPGPVVTTHPVSSSLCNTGNTTFSVVGTGAVSYRWQKNNVDLNDAGIFSGVTTSTLTVTGATTTDNNTTYRCVLTGGNTCTTTSSSAFLYVYSTPAISTQPANSSKCAGTNTTFAVAITSSPAGLTYQWQEKVGSGSFANLTNGGVYSTVTAATLTLTGVTAAMSGNKYRCVVGACSSPVISFEADLVVDSPPVVTLQPVASIICAGMTTTFVTNATGLGVTFQWQKEATINSGSYTNITNTGIFSGATTETLTLTNVSIGETGFRYRCVVTASGVCAALNTPNVLLTVRTPPTFDTQPEDKAVCEGLITSFKSSVNFNGAPSVYQWQINEFGLGFVDIAPNVTLYPSGVTGFSLSIASTVLLNGNKYRLRVGACTPNVFSSEVTLTVKQTPTITVQPVDKTICKGETTTFTITATGSELTYQWIGAGGTGGDTPTLTLTNVSAGLNGTKIYCLIKGATGCSQVQSAEVTLTVNNLVITTQPTSVNPFCPGGNASYSIVAEGTSLTYQWQEDNKSGTFTDITNGGVYSGVTTNKLVLTGVPFTMSSYRYRCVVKGLCGELNSNPVNLGLFPTPAKPAINVNTNNPEAPVLTAPNGQTFKWYKNGTLVSSSSSLTVTSEGSYTVIISVNGCESVASDALAIVITGDQENLIKSSLQVYPNPASDRITLSLGGFEKDKSVSISIVDMQGRVIEKTSGLGEREVSIDIRNYTSGKYVAWLQQRTAKVSRQFIKSDKQ